MKDSDELTGFICPGFSGIGWETTPKFVKVLNFDKGHWNNLPIFLPKCEGKPVKKTFTALQKKRGS